MISRNPQSTFKVSSKRSNGSGDTDFEEVIIYGRGSKLGHVTQKLTYKIWLKWPSCF